MSKVRHSKILWIKHKLSLHHYRHNRKHNTVYAMCTCGYKHMMFHRIAWVSRRRKITQGCFIKGHDWREDGPEFRQCKKCYECEYLGN